MKKYFLRTKRIGFSKWNESDYDLAVKLWGEKEVTHFICASGKFTEEDIRNRLNLEIRNEAEYGVQYWPIFNLGTGDIIGCCGLRPYPSEAGEKSYEIGAHLRKEYWRQGYAFEAADAVITYCFTFLNAYKIFAGHHPENTGSKGLLNKLNFKYVGDEFYEPTGLYHPSYELVNRKYVNNRRTKRGDENEY